MKFFPALKVFAYGFSLDFMYILWFSAISKDYYLRAGAASILLTLPSLFGLFEILENKKLAVPYLAGIGLGTMASMYLF